MKQITAGQLTELEFFREIPKETIQTMLNEGRILKAKRKELLFGAREELEPVYILLSGKVMLYNLTKHGNRKVVFILGEGHLLNENIISRKPMPMFCETVSEAVYLKVPGKVFRKLMEHNPGLTTAVLREYERYLWRMSHQLKNTTGNMQMERKIAAKLWKLARDFGVPEGKGIRIDMDFTITLMADLVGAPRENVSRACKALSDKGLLQYRNRQFILPDPDQMAEFYKM